MAVYIELVTEDLDQQFRKNLDNRRRAGVSNVRRPLRGFETKEDTYGVLRVIQSDGTVVKLTDSSWPEGQGRGFSNFLIQSVQDARMERHQIIETFGAPLVFFFGESPRFVDVQAVLLNSHDFNWEAEWWENYNKFLRGTRLVEMGARAYLFYDDTILEGYPLNATAVKSSSDKYIVQLSFRMFISNYASVSAVGDTAFPVHGDAIIPELAGPRDERSFTFAVESANEESRRAYGQYLKRLGIVQIQNEIAKAKTIERVRELQRQYALESLGIVPEGANLLAAGASFLQGVAGAIRGDNETVAQANERFRAQAKKALQLTMEGNGIEAMKLLAAGKGKEALAAAQSRSTGGAPYSLADIVRQGLLHSAGYPGQNFDAFLKNVESLKFENQTTQIMDRPELRRTLPWRSQIVDNLDEYTAVTEDEAAAALFSRIGAPVAGTVADLPSAVSQAVTNAGGSPSPMMLKEMNLVNWSPLPGVKVEAGSLDQPAPFTGSGYAYTYSKQWGSTPSAGGSSGGALGGGFGPGLGGKAQDPFTLRLGGGALPQGSPYGGDSSVPSYAYTAGLGPDGKPLIEGVYVYGPTPGGYYFSGNAILAALSNRDKSTAGQGAFGVYVVDGELK